MLYMIETGVTECVLICLDVYVGFQDQKLVKIKQEIADLAPSIPKIQSWCLNIVLRQS